jgi:hypothetical protein
MNKKEILLTHLSIKCNIDTNYFLLVNEYLKISSVTQIYENFGSAIQKLCLKNFLGVQFSKRQFV